jgi:DNA-binding NtrC family response regulator
MVMPETILIVDDDVKMKSIMAEVLQHEGFSILTAMNGKDALEVAEREALDLILCDVKLPDIDGIDLLRQFIHRRASIPVIMISGFATIDRAVAATRLGAYDFLEKPLEPQRVLLTIKNALERSRLEKSQQTLLEDVMQRYNMIGVSDVLRKLCAVAARVAKYQTPVLITGESGTGKEKFAELIHRVSGRQPWIPVNCASVPHDLIESELFGHKKGTFTGAVADKVGKFQAADHGTLFLDEIGDMGLEMQSKILRAIETREICMVGGNESTAVDVRFVAATNKNLPVEIDAGRFREDLYYRLRGVIFQIPPLRERHEDIPPLANHFLIEYCQKQQIPPKRLTDSAIKTLQEQEWHGNIRELKHVVENLAIFSDDETINHLEVLTLLKSFPRTSTLEPSPSVPSSSSNLKVTTDSYEKNLILQALQEANGNITHAAEKLNMERATLSKKIKRHGLKA